MRTNRAGKLIVGCLMIMVAAGSTFAAASQDDQQATEDAATRLEAALARAVRPYATPWKATFVETTVHRDGRQETMSDRESGTIVGSPKGVLFEKSASLTSVVGSLAVLHGPSMSRSAEGLGVYPTPPPFLCNIPSIAPTVESLRGSGMVPREFWDTVSVRMEGSRTVYEIAMKPHPALWRQEYVLKFEGDERAGRLSGFAWRKWLMPEGGGEPPLDLSIEVEMDGWVKVGDSDVPSRVTREVCAPSRGEPPPHLRTVQRIELSPTEIPAEEAEAALKAGSTPRLGELVRDYARSAEYRVGEAWIKVGGVEFDL